MSDVLLLTLDSHALACYRSRGPAVQRGANGRASGLRGNTAASNLYSTSRQRVPCLTQKDAH